ncbi:predicted protein [Nematostella vectensis]|uniref:CSC1/OSCA1-like N-terminal transmembrane domain-containing protein n=3 Tax=Nematostella vectensis TaxID=45351 RepID=A7SQ88_NEMVE|nr:predicted protein [Nematostella vectensis]|eukprot:XP_001626223.1 predicted protein [Nematostella vectensis]
MDDRGDDSYGFSKRNLYEDLIKALRAANDSGATTNNNTSRNVQVDSTDVFLVSLTLNAILTLLVFALFCLLRPRMQRLYSPRLLLIKPVSTFVKYSDSLFGWLLPAMTVTDDSIFNDIGIDALVYIRLIKLCFKISLVILPYGIIVLLPLNLHGGLHLSGLDKLTMSNMHEKSTKAWAHLVGVWAYTLIICYLLYKEWQVYLVYRRKHLAKGLPHQYAVLLRGLTSKLKNRETLRKYADGIFPGQVVQVIMVENLKNWNALVAQHDKSILALEKAKFKLLANGKRPQHRVRCFGKKTDTIIFHKNNLKTLHGLLEEEIERDRPFRPSAFIVFRSLRVASMAAQVLWDDSVRLMNVQPAPDKHDVNWTSLSVGFVSR